MGRSHDYFCHACGTYWSPFLFDSCPCGAPEDQSEYDLNYELAGAALEREGRDG